MMAQNAQILAQTNRPKPSETAEEEDKEEEKDSKPPSLGLGEVPGTSPVPYGAHMKPSGTLPSPYGGSSGSGGKNGTR